MADQGSTYSRIYDLKLQGLDKVVTELNSVALLFDKIGQLKKGISLDFNFGDANMSSLASTVTKIQAINESALETAKIATETAKQQTEASKQAAQAKMAEAKASTENARAQEIETRYTIALTKEKERIEKAAEKAAQQLAKEQSAYHQLNAEYKEAAALAQELGAKKVLLEREAASGYGGQVNQTELARLGPQLKEAQANAMRLHTSLLDIEQAVGKSQRNVGNYNSAVMAMSQILREAPSFAYNFSTGLLAISNNIPILVDEVERLKKVNEGLKASGEKTIPIWKTLMGAITSPSGLITIATSAITILAARMTMAGGAMSEAEQQARKLRESFIDLSATIQDNLTKELEKTETLFKTAADMGASYEARTSAINELLKLYPELLANISQEAFLNGKVVDSQLAISDIIAKRAHSDELGKQIESLSKQRNDLQKKIQEFKEDETAPGATWRFITGDRDPAGDMQKEVDKLNKKIGDLQDILKLVNQQIGYMLNPKHDGRLLSDIDADIKAQQRLRDTTEAGTDAHKRAIAQLKALNEERRKYLGEDDKKPKERDYTNEALAALKAEIDAKYELRKKEIEIEATANKEIYTDETKSLSERLAAFRAYSDNQRQILETNTEKQVEEIDSKLEAIARIQKIKEADRTPEQKTLLLSEKALLAQKEVIYKSWDLERLNQEIATQKGITAIQKEEIQKRLDQVKYLNENAQTQEDAALQRLSEQLSKEEITVDVYNKRKQQIEDKYQMQRLQNLKAYLEEQAKDMQAAGLETAKVQEAITAVNHQISELGVSIAERNAKLSSGIYKQAIDELFQFAEAAGQAFFQAEAQKDAVLDRRAQKQADWAHKMMDAEVQSKREKEQYDKAFAMAEEERERERMAREKKRAEAELEFQYAIAIMKAVAAHVGDFGIGAAIESAGITAIFGAKLAMLESAPAYAQGTGNSSHPGGLAWVGDGGENELIRMGNMFAVSPNVATLTNLPAGAEVTPFSKITSYSGTMGSQLQAPSFSASSSTAGSSNNLQGIFESIHSTMHTVMAGMQNMKVTLDTQAAGRAISNNYFKKVHL